MDKVLDDRELYGGLIRLHVLDQAIEAPLYGQWMIEELRRHGYGIGPGPCTRSFTTLSGKCIFYRNAIPQSLSDQIVRTSARGVARRRVQELFGEMFENAQRNRKRAT